MKKRTNLIEREFNSYHYNLEADYRKKTTGMSQTIGVMIAKISIGAIFVLCGISILFKYTSVLSFFISLIIGGGLIAWGVVPYVMGRKVLEQQEMERVLSIPLQTYEDAELKAAIGRIEDADSKESVELKKYKEMLDKNLISPEDYELKKKQILGL